MSKLGVHVASSARNGFGRLLAAGAPLVVAVDQDVMAEAHAASALVAFRTQRSPMGEDNPPGLLDVPLADVPLLATRWMEALWPIYRSNPSADWYIVNNELDVSTIESAMKLNAFFLACMSWCDSRGIKAGICSFSTGCPSDDGGLTLEQRWQPLLPAVRYAAEHGHVVVLHAHAMQHGPLTRTGNDIAYRHERSLRYFAQHNIYPMVIVGELSNGVGGVEPTLDEYLAEMKIWDEHVMVSEWRDQVLGGALYGFNAAESIASAVTPLAEWIASHPTPTDPIEPPPSEIRHYDRVVHLLPQATTYDRLLIVANEAYPRRETLTFSADDAFINAPGLDSRKVYVWHVDAFGGREYFEAWVDAWYAPRPEIIYREWPV